MESIFIFLLAILAITSGTLQKGNYEPQMVIELFRTGARAPIKNTFNQAWVNTVQPGYLTSNGER